MESYKTEWWSWASWALTCGWMIFTLYSPERWRLQRCLTGSISICSGFHFLNMFENISKTVMRNSMGKQNILCMKFYTLDTTKVLTGANAIVTFGKRPGFWNSFVCIVIYNFYSYHNIQFYPLKPKDEFTLIKHLTYIYTENPRLKLFENHLGESSLPSSWLIRAAFSTFRLSPF